MVRPTTGSTAQPDRGHSPAPGIDPSPPMQSLVAPKQRGTSPPHGCTSSQATIGLRPSDYRRSSSWICIPTTSCYGQDLQQAGARTDAGLPGPPRVDSGLGELQRVGFASHNRRTDSLTTSSNPYGRRGWRRSSTSHRSSRPLGMSKRRRTSLGILLPPSEESSPRRARSPLQLATAIPTRSSRRRQKCMVLWEHASVACGMSLLWPSTSRLMRSSI